ncbi:hypothetical protein MOV66_01150 [Agrobacterium sp. SHOUNA12C]|uniref:hypothetical protein n=1 Tax=Rhizobium rhizogenes TaxID=359 RepID=UPI00103E5B42|nr:hypothetical protein [Rhizobium rhizogenes]MCJ9719824.1 hypothetical protein [Agrobacterium sp. BETTINA12B]MCJ9755241.1 hypothetical protein [Agrobacterium sp. SHOUNA12C]NTF55630.1 hypothetical protein [Rhizobium rhizogenes]NTF61989.1 hypothetical protein [Rhizobium rhizogenes]NTF75210.1 hypothetical protein [Rhizobium rhizogenes]
MNLAFPHSIMWVTTSFTASPATSNTITDAGHPVDFRAKAPEAGGMITNRATMMHLLTTSPLAGRVEAALR